jgi:hypothetical protein
MLKKSIGWMLLPAAAAVLVACGGGGGQATNSLSGVAAVGAPIADATITLRDVNGKTTSVTSDAAGEYSFPDLSGYVAPFQITAAGQMGDREVVHHALVSKIAGAQTANISQLTTAATALLVPSATIGELSPSQLSAMTEASINGSYDTVKTVLKPLTDKLVPGTVFDPLTTPFKANGEGADLLLDHVALNTRAGFIELSNKMATDADGETVGSVVIGKTAGSTISNALDAKVIDPPKFKALLDKFTACFAVSHTTRLTNKTTTSATLDPACADLAVTGYVHNGAPFMLRWAKSLNSDTINTTAGAQFKSVDIRLLNNATPLRLAVNINWQDNTGSGYTTPEVIEKQTDGTWKLYGNRRAVAASVDATLNYLRDMTVADYNNVNFSRIESGMRFQFDPRITFDASTGVPDLSATIDYTSSTGYKKTGASFSAINSAKGAKTITQCVVVTGPGNFDTAGTKWMGVFPHGLMMKRPSGSSVQDYLAIDRRLTQSQKTALVNTTENSVISIANFCDITTNSGETDTSSSTYLVESEPLKNQVHPLTGVLTPAMDGRDAKWNTGARYARLKPDTALAKTFDNNPVFTFYVIDSTNKLRMKFKVRYLGELPPASVAKDLVDADMLSVPTKETLTKYLKFDATGTAAAALNNQTSVDATWTTKTGAYGADLIGFYSEVFKGRPGRGLRGPDSIHLANQSLTPDGIWAADDDLATALDAMPGNNFWNAASGFAKEKNTSTACSPSSTTSTVDTSSFSVGRSKRALTSSALASGSVYYGLDGLAEACLGTSFSTAVTNAYLYREVWTRTYTEKNVRVYHITANKAFRQ